MTWCEIRARHFGEWVLVRDIEYLNEDVLEIGSAVVCAHSPNRRETIARMKDLPAQIHVGHFFIDEYA